MRWIALIVFVSSAVTVFSQKVNRFDTIGIASQSTNIYSRKLHGDSLSTAFCIVIKQAVALHKHVAHSEEVTVLEGEGWMILGKDEFPVVPGDLIFIPKGTPHAVKSTGKAPLKVLSIQSPSFDGKDRVMLEAR